MKQITEAKILPASLILPFALLLVAVTAGAHPAGAVAELPAEPSGLPSRQIRDAARQVMQHNDYRSVRRRVLQQVPESDPDKGFLESMLNQLGQTIGNAVNDFFEWFFGLFSSRQTPAQTPRTPSGSVASGFSQILLYAALLLLLGAVIWIIAVVVRTADGRRQSRDRSFLHTGNELIPDVSVPPGELASAVYESRAVQLAADRNYRAAIRELLLGSMSWIERAGLIRFRKGLTNRDYARAITRQTHRRQAYGVTALEFERVYFGRRDATEEMFHRCLNSFQEAFREDVPASTAEV